MSSATGNDIALLRAVVFNDNDIIQARISSKDFPNIKYEFLVHPDVHACRCSAEHNSFLYIGEDRVIDKNVFDNICTSLQEGQCPHIARMPESDLKTDIHPPCVWYLVSGDESTFQTDSNHMHARLPHRKSKPIEFHDEDLSVSETSLLYVATAVGNINVISHLISTEIHYNPSDNDPIKGEEYIAFLQRLHKRIEYHNETTCKEIWDIASIQKQNNVLELLVTSNELIRDYLRGLAPEKSLMSFLCSHIHFAVEHSCATGIDMFLSNLVDLNMLTLPLLRSSVIDCVWFDRPQILAVLSRFVNIRWTIQVSKYPDFNISTWQLAKLLKYQACADEIKKQSNGEERIIELNTDTEVKLVVWLLKSCPRHARLTAEALVRLAKTSPIDIGISGSRQILNHLLHVKSVTFDRHLDAIVLSAVLDDIGCDVNTDLSAGNGDQPSTILSDVLRQFMSYMRRFSVTRVSNITRNMTRAVLYANPSTDIDTQSVITHSGNIDDTMLAPNMFHKCFTGAAIEPSQLLLTAARNMTKEDDTGASYTDLLSDGRFSEMIFYIPILFEHGFHLPMSTITSTQPRHPLQQSIYRSLVSTPRSLKSRARVVLRRAYPGRRIHRFVEQTTLPESIKEYILMIRELNIFCKLRTQ